MRLEEPFYRLPLTFDVARMRLEVEPFEEHAWRTHPNGISGNSALLLATVRGEQNDGFPVSAGIAPTPALERMPYMRQVAASLKSPISRSRLMRVEPGYQVPWHDDVNFHWRDRIRVHVPIVTDESVRFHVDDVSVHMRAGECWIFDNFARHKVDNDSKLRRIHAVFDVYGREILDRFSDTMIPVSETSHELEAGPAPMPYRPDWEPELRFDAGGLQPISPEDMKEYLGSVTELVDSFTIPDGAKTELLKLTRGFEDRWKSQYHAENETFAKLNEILKDWVESSFSILTRNGVDPFSLDKSRPKDDFKVVSSMFSDTMRSEDIPVRYERPR